MNRALPYLTLIVTLGLGCSGDTRGAPQVSRNLTGPPSTEALNLPLSPVSLVTHADFDRFEKRTLNRIPFQHRAEVYEALWRGHLQRHGLEKADAQEVATRLGKLHREGRAPGALRALQRLTLITYRMVRQSGKSQVFIQLANLLRSTGGNDPDALFVLNFARSDFLRSSSGDHTYRLTPTNRKVAKQLVVEWERLLKHAPKYKGPWGWDAKKIRDEVMVLKRVLSAQNTGKPSKARDQKPDPQGVAEAQKILWALERGQQLATEAECKARRKQPKGSSELVAYADLRCALTLRDPKTALARLARLAGTATLGDVCGWVRKLKKRSPRPLATYQGAAALQSRLEALQLPPCGELAPGD